MRRLRKASILRATALAAASAIVFAGCAVPPRADSTPPALDLPMATPPTAGLAPAWWNSFRDAQLSALVDEALAANRDLARAAARIDQSRAALRLARADRLPRIDAGVSSGRQRASENAAFLPPGAPLTASDHRVSIDVAYEVDLWSRLANTQEAARADLLASAFARDTLRTALAAQVVQSYVALQALDARVALFERTVQAQRDSLALQRKRFDAGDIGELDIRQLEAELIGNEAQLPKLERARGESERALALVLGRSPREVVQGAVSRSALPAAVPAAAADATSTGVQLPATVPAAPQLPSTLPSDLLERRPDVQAALARLRAAGARVDAARAAYFPSISLTAGLGRESAELSSLTHGASLIWSVLASLTQPIWDGGRIDAQNEFVRASWREVEIDYRDTVATAFKEARDALAARTETDQSLRNAVERERALAQAARLTRLRFDRGEESRIELIRAEVVDAQRAVAAAQADVFRVLGGGWSGTEPMMANATVPAVGYGTGATR
ncbi:MAG: efflux transporter outer membrane subunit [Gammaproteobacteria bacterium]